MKTYRWQNDQAGIVEDDISAAMKAKSRTTDERSVPAYVVNMQGSKSNAQVTSDGKSPTLNAMHGHDVHAVLSENQPLPPDPSKAKACNMDGSGPDLDKTGCLVGGHPGGTTDLTPVVYGPVKCATGDKTHALTSEGADASEDGTGRGTPIVAQPIPILEAGARTGKSTTDPRAGMGVGEPGDPMFTLQAGKQHAVTSFNARQDPITSEEKALPVDTDGSSQAICFQQNSRSEVRDMGGKTGAVTSEPGAQCQNYIFDPLNGDANGEKCTSLGTNCGGSTGRSIAFTQNQAGDVLTGDKAPAMGTNQNATGRNTPKVQTGMAVRRLTPRECERLQGFPDDWTRIPWRGKKAEECPDGPRYKACGNSMAVPVMRWIGNRIEEISKESEK